MHEPESKGGKRTMMFRKYLIPVGAVVVLSCLVVAGIGGVLLVQNVPAAYRLVHGDSSGPTPAYTSRPTFTPALATATLTPLPTDAPLEPPPSPAPTFTSLPTAEATRPSQESTAAPPSATLTPSLEPPAATSLPPTPTPTPRPQWIVFETKRKDRSDYEIFVMTPSGARLTNLTNSWADDVAPVWSPDGRRVAFVSLRDTAAGKWGLGPSSVYVLEFDPATGTRVGEPFAVTGKDTDDGWPTWSPDGQRLAFESSRGGNWDIWVSHLDGSGLVNVSNHPADDRYPAWSPNGKKVAFTSNRSGNWEVWLMNADGSNPVNLTNSPGRDRYTMWSPDGRQVTFNTERDGDQEIYVMNADGSNPHNVSNSPKSTEGLADWSPEGKRLVLYSTKLGNKDIFILNLSTGKWTTVTQGPSSDEFCTWSP